jgi:hypothetical protein
LKKGVTSKKNSGHMGYGLWLIDEFAEASNGDFAVCSEGGYFYRRGKRIKKGECGNWKGTIVYVRIPLNNLHGLSVALDTMRKQYENY